ncbi:MAG: chorismate mutase [Sphingomicrobium sp.]
MTPEKCMTMAEVRAGVDETDRQIVELIVQRFGFMDAAARIKQDRSTVRDERRKAEVLAHIGNRAREAGVDPAAMVRMYDDLIEASIAHELRAFDRIRG